MFWTIVFCSPTHFLLFTLTYQHVIFQKSSIDGSLHQGSNSNQMTQESMMSLQQNPMQQHHHQSNQMVSYNLVSEDSSVRLPPLTLNDRSYSISSTVHLSNGLQCQLQQNELTDNTHQSSQVNQCDYNQNMSEQSEQPILRPSRMESTNQSHQNIDSMYHIDQPQQVVFQANLQNRSNRVMQQTPNNSSNHQNHLSLKQPHLSMNSTQLQSGFQTGNRMMPSFQVNPTTQDQVPHLSHMDQPPPTQHSMNSVGVSLFFFSSVCEGQEYFISYFSRFPNHNNIQVNWANWAVTRIKWAFRTMFCRLQALILTCLWTWDQIRFHLPVAPQSKIQFYLQQAHVPSQWTPILQLNCWWLWTIILQSHLNNCKRFRTWLLFQPMAQR